MSCDIQLGRTNGTVEMQKIVDRINQRVKDELISRAKVNGDGIIWGSDVCKIINEELGFEDGFINQYPDQRIEELNEFFVEDNDG